jgi:hypothetical protein
MFISISTTFSLAYLEVTFPLSQSQTVHSNFVTDRSSPHSNQLKGLTSCRCNDRRPCDRCRATCPEACVDPAEASDDAAASAALADAAAAARAREEEESALLWRSFASTAAAARAAGAGAGVDASSARTATVTPAALTLAGISPSRFSPAGLGEDKDVLRWSAGAAAATDAAMVPAQGWASYYPDYTAEPTSGTTLSAAAVAQIASKSAYAQDTYGGNYRGGGGGGGAAWRTVAPMPTASSEGSAAAGQTPWAAAALAEPTLRPGLVVEHGRREFLQQQPPQDQFCRPVSVGYGGAGGALGRGGSGGGGAAVGAATGFGGSGDGLPHPFAAAAANLNEFSAATFGGSTASAGSVVRSDAADADGGGVSAGPGGDGSGARLEWAWEAASGPGPADALQGEFWRE